MKRLILVGMLVVLLTFSGCVSKTHSEKNNSVGSINQNSSEQNSSEQNSSEQNSTEQNSAEQNSTEQNSAEQNSTEQNSAEQNSTYQEQTDEPLRQEKFYDYGYSLLNEKQKNLYNKILVAVNDMQKSKIYLMGDEPLVNENINMAYTAMSVDHPEIFWLEGRYQLFSDANNGIYIEIAYNMDRTSRDSLDKLLNNKVSEIMSATEGMSYFEKELYFHDYLCNNITYMTGDDNSAYTVIGALVKGKAVCEGYSRAMQLLCKTAGINCTLVKGTSEDTAHMWNIVEISGEWYELDVTWDDADGRQPRYNYFNITTEQMRKDHVAYICIAEIIDGVNLKGGKYNFSLPECTAVTFSKQKIK